MLRFVSQPPAGFESQSPNPELQVGLQTPAVHVVVPFALVHAVEQSPQCVVAVDRSTSQPLVALLSQLPKPELQAMPQVPLEHEAVPCVESQTLAHAPQFWTSPLTLVSQPLAGSPSQSP